MERDEAHAVASRAADYTKLRRGAEAERMLRAALTTEPGNAVLLIELARALHAQQRYDEALSAAEAACAAAPHHPEAHHRRAWVLRVLGRHTEAALATETALDILPTNRDPLRDHGRFLALSGQTSNAIEAFHRGLSEHPGDPRMLSMLGEALHRKGRYREAADVLKTALANDPESATASMALGMTLLRLRRARESLAALDTAARLDPRNIPQCNEIRRLMTWPITKVYARLRWILPPLALAALVSTVLSNADAAAHGTTTSPALPWAITVAAIAALAHATHWAIRAGSRGWRAIGRVPPPPRITLTAGLGLGASGLAAVLVSVWTASAVLAASGLVAGLALWPVLAYEWASPPFKKRLLSPLPKLGRPSRE